MTLYAADAPNAAEYALPPTTPPNRRRALARLFQLLSNPYLLIASMAVGAYIGLCTPAATAFLAPFADLYLGLLKMVLIPFLISAIMVSLSRLFGSEGMRREIGPIVGVFVSGLAIAAVLGIAGAVSFSPGGNISNTSREVLGDVVDKSPYAVDIEIALNAPPVTVKDLPDVSMFERFIPTNIFGALTSGDQLKILFFAIVFGIGLGSLRIDQGAGLYTALLSTYDLCTQLITWTNKLLPVALCAMVAKQTSTVGGAQLGAMIDFTIGFALLSIIVCCGVVFVVAWGARCSLLNALRVIREPLLLAMATRSSVACIPITVSSLTERLGYDRTRAEMLLPLGMTLFRFGPVLYFAFATIFVAQLHGVALTSGSYLLIFSGSMLAGFASAGTSGVLTISLLGVIFQPLGLPLEAALALLVTIDPVIDIFRTAAIVLPNCAAVAVVYRKRRSVAEKTLSASL
jgi:proton glutamate symport protein